MMMDNFFDAYYDETISEAELEKQNERYDC